MPIRAHQFTALGPIDWFPGTGEWFRGTIERFPGTGEWFPGTIGWFPGTGEWFRGTIEWFHGTGEWFRGPIEWFHGMRESLRGTRAPSGVTGGLDMRRARHSTSPCRPAGILTPWSVQSSRPTILP